MTNTLFYRVARSFAALVFLTCCITANASTLYRLSIKVEKPEEIAQQLEQMGHDIFEHGINKDSVELVVNAKQLQLLKKADYDIVILERGRPFSERPDAVTGPDMDDVLSGKVRRAPPSGYKDLAAVLQEMQAVAQLNPAIATFVDITQTYSTPTTVEGRHIYALKISDNVTTQEDEPTALIVSNHHAREIVTPELALYAMRQLVEQYATNTTVADVVNNNEIWIVPVWNPDGYNYVFTSDNLWRKNRRVFSSGVGVDLNRNYPTGWSSSCGGSTNVSSNTYRGPSSASEAETRTMMTLSENKHFFKIIDFHSAGRETLYSYPSNCATHPFQSWLRQLAQGISGDMGYGSKVRAPSAFGEHYQWQMVKGAHAFLVETASEFQPSYNSAQQEAQQVWPGILNFLYRSVPLSGKITDATTGAIIAGASIELPGVNYTEGEANSSNSYGRYQVYAPAGQRTVRFNAPGYTQLDRSVTLTDTTATILDIQLSKSGSNSAPQFTSNPINKPDATIAVAYTGSLSGDATDPNPGDTLSFTKVSGPTWLSVVNNGDLSGTPQQSDTGSNSFQVRVTDQGGLSDNATLNIAVTTGQGGNKLENGVPKTNLSANTGEDIRYTMDVPSNATNIKFVINGGSGDADLYVKFGSAPTDNSYDCRPYLDGNNESCTGNATGGTYHIRVKAYAAFSGLSLTGSYNN